MPKARAASSALRRSRDAMAAISARAHAFIAGMTFLVAMLATPRTPPPVRVVMAVDSRFEPVYSDAGHCYTTFDGTLFQLRHRESPHQPLLRELRQAVGRGRDEFGDGDGGAAGAPGQPAVVAGHVFQRSRRRPFSAGNPVRSEEHTS